MQNAKDTFYVTLQGRLSILNPARTMVLRGIVRPGILVTENELTTATIPVNAFRLEWGGVLAIGGGPLPLAAIECSIQYATDGDPGNGGMDRGRLLAAMDAELAAVLATEPHTVQKMNYAASGAGVAPTAMATNVFWADPSFGEAKVVGERLERTATVQVFAYQEAGEL